ncbi:MAG: CHASE2 domain-containing protein [Phormidesmis sp. RL_2_1]|nr:CHASE2 domain-containing protein [Phormidesmis sp. RL_2_1]
MMKRLNSLVRVMPGLVAGMSIILLMKLQAWTPLERTVSTQLMRWRGPMAWDDRIVMVSIDNETLKQLGQFPISRTYYANLLERLSEADTSVVVFNMLFSDPGPATIDPQTNHTANDTLAQAMITHGRVVLGQAWGSDEMLIEPIPVLAEAAIAIGHLRLSIDTDGMTRTVETTWRNVPTLGVAAVQVYGLTEELVAMPTDLDHLTINWPSFAADLTTVSLIDVLNGHIPADHLQDKIVIVSYGATTGREALRTPFDNEMPIQGGYMHAAVIDNLLNQSWLRVVPESSIMLFLLLGGPLFGGLLYQRKIAVQLALCGGISASWLLICIVFLSWGYLLPVVTPLVAVLLVSGVVAILDQLQSNAVLQVRSAFLNTISHEIRTPLNSIVNLSEMLRETPLDSRQQEFADILYNSSQTLLALINDILDFSKIESGQFLLESYPVKLVEVIERSIEMLAPRAAEKGIELVYALDPNTPAVIMSDPVRLQQILLNLLSNAVKFTDMGEVSVRVDLVSPASATGLNLSRWFLDQAAKARLDKRSAETVKLRFAVRDTGIGILPERMSKLFKPFIQASSSTTRQYGGTGLGLSISQRLSERMHGELWAHSYPHEGSTFYFTVQVQPAVELAPFPSYLAGLSGTRLLLIDGNETRRDRLMWTMQMLNIELRSPPP